MIIHKLLEGSLQAATWGVGQCHGDGGNDTPLSNTAHFRDEECARWIGGMLRTYTAGNTLGRSVYTADGWGPECTRQGPVWDGECTRPKHPPSCTISVTGDSLPCTLFALFCTRWEPDGDEKCARRGHSLPRLLLVRERSSTCALFGIPGQDGARRVRFPSRTGVHRCGVSRSGRKAGVEVRVERLADGGPEVAKAEWRVVAPAPKAGLVADGSELELVVPGSVVGGTMQYAIGAESGPTLTYSEVVPTATEGGTYRV